MLELQAGGADGQDSDASSALCGGGGGGGCWAVVAIDLEALPTTSPGSDGLPPGEKCWQIWIERSASHDGDEPSETDRNRNGYSFFAYYKGSYAFKVEGGKCGSAYGSGGSGGIFEPAATDPGQGGTG